MFNLIDISWPVTPAMTTYKNKSDVQLQFTHTWEQAQKREAKLSCGLHSGTHVDAPSHFLADGVNIEQVGLEQLCGPAQILDLTHVTTAITAGDLQPYTLQPGTIILLQTRNSALAPNAPFNPEFIYLRADGAAYLVAQKIKAVGIDYLGIERDQPGHPTHRQLLQAQIPIMEGLRLGHVPPGDYQLYCLPLRLQGVAAAPARGSLVPPAPLATLGAVAKPV